MEHKKTGINRFKYKEYNSYLAKLALIASTSTNLMIGLAFKILIAATLLLATASFLLSLRFSLVTAWCRLQEVAREVEMHIVLLQKQEIYLKWVTEKLLYLDKM